jgi:RecJ-like exonuclease
MSEESCGICGGDGRIGNSFGSTTTCPSCHGGGRRAADTGMRDVTKTKPSHYAASNRAPVAVKAVWPVTSEGEKLATDVKGSSFSDALKAKLVQDIIDHEGVHGLCTKTFLKKVRHQLRSAAG